MPDSDYTDDASAVAAKKRRLPGACDICRKKKSIFSFVVARGVSDTSPPVKCRPSIRFISVPAASSMSQVIVRPCQAVAVQTASHSIQNACIPILSR